MQRQGSWLAACETRLGQGRESARMFLRENPKFMQQLEKDIRQRAAQEGAAAGATDKAKEDKAKVAS